MEPGRLQSMGSHVRSNLAPMQYLIQVKPLVLNVRQCYILLFSRSVLLSLAMVLP